MLLCCFLYFLLSSKLSKEALLPASKTLPRALSCHLLILWHCHFRSIRRCRLLIYLAIFRTTNESRRPHCLKEKWTKWLSYMNKRRFPSVTSSIYLRHERPLTLRFAITMFGQSGHLPSSCFVVGVLGGVGNVLVHFWKLEIAPNGRWVIRSERGIELGYCGRWCKSLTLFSRCFRGCYFSVVSWQLQSRDMGNKQRMCIQTKNAWELWNYFTDTFCWLCGNLVSSFLKITWPARPSD